MVELPSWIIVVSGVQMHSNISLFQAFIKISCSFNDILFFSLERNRNNDYLNVGSSGGKHKTFIISMIHSHDTDWTSSKAPTCLPNKFLFFLLILKLYSEHFCKVLAQVVRGSCLNSSSIFWNPSLHSWSLQASWEFLRFSLDSFANGHSKNLLVNSVVELKIIKHLKLSFFEGSMGSVSFLPKEFTSSDEGSWMFEFPTNNVSPLIEFERQVTMTLNPVCVGRIHDCFTCWSNSDGFAEITASRFGHPGYFWCETFYMIFFNLQWFLWDKHREIGVFYTVSLNKLIKKDLNLFPNRVSPRAKDVATRNIVIIDKSWLDDDLLIPSWEIGPFFGFNTEQINFFIFFLLFFTTFFLLFFLLNFFSLLEKVQSFERNFIMG